MYKPLGTLLAVVLCGLGVASPVMAGDLLLEDAGVQLTLPDGWEAMEQDGVLLVGTPNGGTAISFMLVDPEQVEATLTAMFQDLEPFGEPQAFELNGMPASEMVGASYSDDVRLYVDIVTVAVPTGQALIAYGAVPFELGEQHQQRMASVLATIRPAGGGAAPAAGAAAGGRFLVQYQPGEDEHSAAIAGFLAETRIFDELAVGLSETIVLPHDIPVVFTNCGTPNAFYNPDQRVIVMCYEFMAYFETLARQDEDVLESDEEVIKHVVDTGLFFFLHEVGHALIHVLDIPTTGKEEDAVDDLATVLLIEGEQADTAISALMQFALFIEAMPEDAEFPWWDEHSLDPQRMYALACMLYGSDTDGFGEFVGEDFLPEERAVRCPAEYQQKATAWLRLLDAHLRE